jgi:hypothetical protein
MEISRSSEQFEFTPEQLQFLRSQEGLPLHIPVEETNKVYLLVEQGTLPTLDEDYIRQGLCHAAEQAAQGNEREWDPEEIKAAGRELLAQRNHRT